MYFVIQLKPGCLNEITQYFAKLNVKPNEIIVIGDRLFTDMLMANMMGSWGCWINQGVELSDKILPKLERDLYNRLVVNRPENPYFPPTQIKVVVNQFSWGSLVGWLVGCSCMVLFIFS